MVRALARDGAQRLRSPWQAAVTRPEDQRDAAWAGLLAYERAKRASAAFDFDDLLLYAAVALESDRALRASLGRRWRHVLLDEVQDTNPAQYRIVSLLAAEHRNLMILGDPDQAICAYRGATSEENFAAFARDFPEHDVVTLERNYRSTATILSAANALIAANRGRAGQAPVDDGARWRPDRGRGLPTTSSTRRSGSPRGRGPTSTPARRRRQLCVLVRVNELAAGIEQALMAARVPVHVAGALGFCDRAEIRDALAALSLVANPRDRLAFARVARAAGAGVGRSGVPGALRPRRRASGALALLEHGERSPLDALRPRQAGGGPRAVRRAAGRQPSGSSAGPAT